MSDEIQETVSDILDDKEAEIARLKAALSASNYELDLARSNSMKMYHRLNAENIRNTEMDRETIHCLQAENARLRAALKPVLEAKREDCWAFEWAIRCSNAVNEAQRIYKGNRESDVK